MKSGSLTLLSRNFTEHNRIVSYYPASVFTYTSTSIESEYTEIFSSLLFTSMGGDRLELYPGLGVGGEDGGWGKVCWL